MQKQKPVFFLLLNLIFLLNNFKNDLKSNFFFFKNISQIYIEIIFFFLKILVKILNLAKINQKSHDGQIE